MCTILCVCAATIVRYGRKGINIYTFINFFLAMNILSSDKNFLGVAPVEFVPPWEGGGGCLTKPSTNGEMIFHFLYPAFLNSN